MTGAEMRASRLRLGLSCRELARAAGIPVAAVAFFERSGRLSPPRHGDQDRLHAIGQALEAAECELKNRMARPGEPLRFSQMTAASVRQCRAHLDLTQSQLARAAGVPVSAVVFYESTGHMPAPMHGNHDRVGAVRAALEAAGVQFALSTAADATPKPEVP